MRQPPRRDPGPPRGILHKPDPAADVQHDRRLPADDLAPFIAHYWSVRWNLGAPIDVETLGHPAVHLTIDVDHDADVVVTGIAGPHRDIFKRRLQGRGQVFGIKFRPAMFRAWLGGSVASLTDVVSPLSLLPHVEVAGLVDVTTQTSPFVEQLDEVNAILRRALPALDDDDRVIRDVVERMAVDTDIVRVDDLSQITGLSERTLQRRFKDSVGVSPKWVLSRYRLHEAAAALRSSSPPSLAELAARLGYADQAHFTRDFTTTIGVSPKRYGT